tara:strand:- start:286 stop:750 length:465 start_codon:yes stop_codon:yes gene_type:complete
MSQAKTDAIVTVPTTRRHQRLRMREWPRAPRRDPHTRLIAQLLELAGPESSVIATSSRPWASATFQGAQHRIILKLTGPHQGESADRLIDRLPDAEFSIMGHIVADACVDERRTQASDDALSKEEDGALPGTCPPETYPPETVLRLSILTIEDW